MASATKGAAKSDPANAGEARKDEESAPNAPPEIDTRTRRERFNQSVEDMVNVEKHMERRRKLVKEATESYWKDLHNLREQGVKQWEAAKSLNKAKGAPYLPNITGRTLLGESVNSLDLTRNRVSLVSFCFVRFGEAHVNSYIEPFVAEFGARSDRIQLVEFNVQENYLKSALLWMSQSYIRRNTPKERHDNYIIHYGGIDDVRSQIGITNTYLGWVFLVDADQRIRWYAHGPAQPQEIETMLCLTRELDARNKRHPAARSMPST
ncbi:ATPase assembly factor ATP10 [Thamnocephalis sphaerospora]|uniref:ATPase assembly factor ATP10 n=1 Tax=Thamnocephalis sphaerospora TaxID=78915 RepID=A0A4V1IX67_9FUNG|nr:ATPase assembly factor ATP10 [Thamnocephalis sphaerospora]|eukprot:RKP09999.1 ATPase assembly factor ATP10 [Thamnocephalis sphaerospora]